MSGMTELLSNMSYAVAMVFVAKMLCEPLQIFLMQRESFVAAKQELDHLKIMIAELKAATDKTETLREDLTKVLISNGIKINR